MVVVLSCLASRMAPATKGAITRRFERQVDRAMMKLCNCRLTVLAWRVQFNEGLDSACQEGRDAEDRRDGLYL